MSTLVVDEPQVVVHETDESYALDDLFDADDLTGERLTQTDLFPINVTASVFVDPSNEER